MTAPCLVYGHDVSRAEVGDVFPLFYPKGYAWKHGRTLYARHPASSDGSRWREVTLCMVFDNDVRADVLVVADAVMHEVS